MHMDGSFSESASQGPCRRPRWGHRRGKKSAFSSDCLLGGVLMLACCLLARRKAGDSRGTSNRARKERAVARLGSLGRSRGGVARSSGRPYLLSFQFTCSSRRTCTTSKKVCNFKGVERGWGERLCEPGRGSSARDVLEVLCRLVRACARAPTQSVLAFGLSPGSTLRH